MTKNVVLVGDSIRMGYESSVRRLLEGQAHIVSPEENGGTSSNILMHLDAWFLEHDPDVVHLNCGLHDIKCPLNTREHQTSFADYEANLRIILSRLQAETRASIVFALTTPVSYARHHATKGFDRYEEDVQEVNAIARRATTELGIAVNDLYDVVMSAGRDQLLLPDGTHYTDAGSRLLGAQVASVIQALL